MPKLAFLTIFPDLVQETLRFGVLRAAAAKAQVAYQVVNLRDFAVDAHGSIDGRPYGGGDGMVMRPEPICEAIESLGPDQHVIYLCPKGKVFAQNDAEALAKKIQSQGLVFLCGRFGGVDERALELSVHERFSLGPFIAAGGEFPSLCAAEAIVRLLPGVLGNEESAKADSFGSAYQGNLEHPLYTRPPLFRGLEVPPVLLQGDHKAIADWQQEQRQKLSLARK